MKKYKLTPEHEAQLPAWRDKWIANAMSTKPMDDEDKRICREEVKNLYRAGNLTPPPDHRIIFVSSPFIMRFAAGFAAAIWWLRENKKPATDAATRDATHDATGKDKWYNFNFNLMSKLSVDLGIGNLGNIRNRLRSTRLSNVARWKPMVCMDFFLKLFQTYSKARY